MSKKMKKQLTVPVDGSITSFRPADYIKKIYGNSDLPDISLLYIQPSIPPILREAAEQDKQEKEWLQDMLRNNQKVGGEILEKAILFFKERGFDKEGLKPISLKRRSGIAMDICASSEESRSDAIVLSTQGKSKLEAFFMGETANKVLECAQICPVWLLKGSVKGTPSVMIGIDSSEASLKAVDHAAFMLRDVNAEVTLFHSRRHLTRFLPNRVFTDSPEAKKMWNEVQKKEIAPQMDRAREMLINGGMKESAITISVIEGTKSTAQDLLSAAIHSKCETIILGRKGVSDNDAYALGSVPKRVLEAGKNIALWVV